MKVVFKPGNAYEEINCFDFREYEHGVVLHNEEGYNIGYRACPKNIARWRG